VFFIFKLSNIFKLRHTGEYN